MHIRWISLLQSWTYSWHLGNWMIKQQPQNQILVQCAECWKVPTSYLLKPLRVCFVTWLRNRFMSLLSAIAFVAVVSPHSNILKCRTSHIWLLEPNGGDCEYSNSETTKDKHRFLCHINFSTRLWVWNQCHRKIRKCCLLHVCRSNIW